jgi:3D (Asp-Asp-Asp) domain-containing protein
MKLMIATLLALVHSATAATVSAYCHCARCCGIANHPAADGRQPVVGLTVAGPRWIPLGTRIYIEGIGIRIVTDRLALAYDDRFDLFVATHREAKRFGLQQHRITILK